MGVYRVARSILDQWIMKYITENKISSIFDLGTPGTV